MLKPILERVLLGWSTGFRGPAADLPTFDFHVSGADMQLDVHAPEGPRTVRGRLSAFPLLAGRFWAAAEQDAEAYRLRGAWIPTLLEASRERPGLDAIVAQPGVRDALRTAAELFAAAGEPDEAALLALRSVPLGCDPEVDGLTESLRERVGRAVSAWSGEAAEHEALLHGLKHADPAQRLQCARACEGVIARLPDAEALEALPAFRKPLRALGADAQPALYERGLALSQAWTRRLFRRRAYRECLDLLDSLLEASVLVLTSLRMRLEARLAGGDIDGAGNDRVRLTRVRARAGDLLTAGSELATEDPDEWYVSALLRVAQAHRAWANGADPCPDRRPVRRRVAGMQRRRHLQAARARLREALELASRLGGEALERSIAAELDELDGERRGASRRRHS